MLHLVFERALNNIVSYNGFIYISSGFSKFAD